jgi:putative hydrolase of the HAD superfamily
LRGEAPLLNSSPYPEGRPDYIGERGTHGERSINKKYEAVIFDLFGTLVDKISLRLYRDTLTKMASTISLSPDDFIKLWFDTQNERGLGIYQNLEDNIAYICHKLAQRVEDTRIKLAAQINSESTTRLMQSRPYATEVLSHLKSNGYKTGLVSDCSNSIPKTFNNMPFAPLLDVTVFSCLVGVQKPDPRIYQLAIEQLAVKPEDCLYIGDGDDHELTGALQVGMHPVLILNPDEDRNDVHRMDFEADEWQGPVISSLQEVLNLIK